MVDIAPLALPTVTDPANNDFFILERNSGGTKKLSFLNAVPDQGAFATIAASQVDQANDTLWVWDNSTGRPREIPVQDIVFGNYGNDASKSSNFSLALGDAIQALEISNAGVTTITLDGNVAGIGGADFMICNFNISNITLSSSNITMFVDGISAPNATIRARRSASVTVNNARSQAIFSGG